MEGHKHFSHTHLLNHHRLQEGEKITCSGCKSSGTIGTVYVCWQCSFFLDEQCFRATRSLKHPYHPSHPLTLSPYPTYPSQSFHCNSCNLLGTGFSYTCSYCEFDIHVQCAYNMSMSTTQQNQLSSSSPHGSIPNHYLEPQTHPKFNAKHGHMLHQAVTNHSTLPNTSSQPQNIAQKILHKSHPNHPLTLVSSPLYEQGHFACNACTKVGYNYSYHCAACQYDLHIECASLPETVKRDDHQHQLEIVYSCSRKGEYICDVCHRNVPKDYWIYVCENCDFGTHCNCVNSDVMSTAESLAIQFAATRIRNKIMKKTSEDIIDLWSDSKKKKWKYEYI